MNGDLLVWLALGVLWVLLARRERRVLRERREFLERQEMLDSLARVDPRVSPDRVALRARQRPAPQDNLGNRAR